MVRRVGRIEGLQWYPHHIKPYRDATHTLSEKQYVLLVYKRHGRRWSAQPYNYRRRCLRRKRQFELLNSVPVFLSTDMLNKTKRAMPAMNLELEKTLIPEAISVASEYLQAGRLTDVEQVCHHVLTREPNNPDALHILGLVAHQAGNNTVAMELIEKAIGFQPSNPVFLNDLGKVYRGLGRPGDAESRCRQALAVKPDYAEAHSQLGNALRDLGRLKEAEESYRQALVYKPDYAEAHSNLGNALTNLGQLNEAVESYRRAIALKPDFAVAHFNLGGALTELESLAEAEASYREALAYKPDFAVAYNNLGNTLRDLERLNEAAESYRQALAVKPDYAEAHSNLGVALNDLGQLEQAEECYRKALAYAPDYAIAHNNLGNVLTSLGRLDEAVESFRRALTLKPDYTNLGNALNALGRVDEAAESYRKALALKPDYPEAHSAFVYQCQHLCAWSEVEHEFEVLRRHVNESGTGKITPFSFLTLPDTGGSEQYACARQFAEKRFSSFLSRPALCDTRSHPDHDKLRIGYLSADYHEHATSYLLAEIIELHDRTRFKIFAYSYGPDDESHMRKRMQTAFDEFHEIRHLPHEAAARKIFDDEIDILIDLKGYTKDTRMQITALRPAPVQVNWLGYPGTLGHPRLADYLIGDPVVTPFEHAAQYSETLALMPHCYQPNDRRRPIGALPMRSEAGLPNQGFVFCSFNQSYKITRSIFDLWCRLLETLPGSVLWLLQSNPAAQNNLLKEAKARGISADRLIFAPKLPLSAHLARLQLADLALDTYPVTSHTTASDALWAGVPLVTRIGETFVTRVAASLLHAAGMSELVTDSADAYLRLALDLARQPKRLEQLRTQLIEGRINCALFDSKRFTIDLERLYQRMWGNHLAGTSNPIRLQ